VKKGGLSEGLLRGCPDQGEDDSEKDRSLK